MRKEKIFKNTLILTTAGLITKILGMMYRIYMANAIGAEGMGLYQLIIPVYVLTWSITCAGFTTTISKLVASENAKKNYANMKKLLSISLFLSVGVSVVVSIILFLMANFIATKIYLDSQLILSLKILSFGIIFMSFGSCVRGYFIGLQQTMVPAISQVVEQVFRMLTIWILADFFIPLGVEYACALAIIGIVVSEFVAFLYVYISYKFKHKNISNEKCSYTTLSGSLLIMSMAMPLTGNRVASSLLSAYENILIPLKLTEFGLTRSESIIEFGKITGMAMPLVYFPSALLTAISISLVPAISEAMAIKDYNSIKTTVSKILLFTSIVGCMFAIIFIIFSKSLGLLIFNEDISLYLIGFGILCPLLYVQIIMSGILNGLGEQLFIFKNSMVSSVIIISFIYFLMPKYGIISFIVGLTCSCLIVTFLDIKRINKISYTNIKLSGLFVFPVLSSILTGLIGHLILPILNSNISNEIISIILNFIILGIIYVILICFTGCIKISEIKLVYNYIKKYLPKSSDNINLTL